MAGMLVASLQHAALRRLGSDLRCPDRLVRLAGVAPRVPRPGLRALVSEHHAPHLVHSAAMLYMYLALRRPRQVTPAAMAGMGAAGGRGPCASPPWPSCSPSCSAPTSSPTWTACPPRPPSPAPPTPGPSPVPGPRRPLSLPAPQPRPPRPPRRRPLPLQPRPPRPSGQPRRLSPGGPGAPGHRSSVTSPRGPVLAGLLGPGVARGCRIAMGVTMAFMLVIMI